MGRKTSVGCVMYMEYLLAFYCTEIFHRTSVTCQNLYQSVNIKPIPVATQSKAMVCGCLLTVIAGSNPAGCTHVWSAVLLPGRSLCNRLITHPEESYRL